MFYEVQPFGIRASVGIDKPFDKLQKQALVIALTFPQQMHQTLQYMIFIIIFSCHQVNRISFESDATWNHTFHLPFELKCIDTTFLKLVQW